MATFPQLVAPAPSAPSAWQCLHCAALLTWALRHTRDPAFICLPSGFSNLSVRHSNSPRQLDLRNNHHSSYKLLRIRLLLPLLSPSITLSSSLPHAFFTRSSCRNPFAMGLNNPLPSSMACKLRIQQRDFAVAMIPHHDTCPQPSMLTRCLNTAECKKCAKILAAFIDPRQPLGPDKVIPPSILANAKVSSGDFWTRSPLIALPHCKRLTACAYCLAHKVANTNIARLGPCHPHDLQSRLPRIREVRLGPRRRALT